MKFHQWVFKILKKQNVTDGCTDGHMDTQTDAQRENSISPLKLRFGGGYNNITSFSLYLSHVMRKPDFYLCKNNGADQLCSNCTADQRLCFRYTDNTIPPLLITLAFFCGCIGQFVSDLEILKTGFLATWLI